MPHQPDPELKAFLASLPKTETHLHIEGALPWDLLNQLDPGRFTHPPKSWDDHYKFSSFAEFEEELLSMAFAWFTSPERYYEAAKKIFNRLHTEENVQYIETSFASGMIEYLGLDGEAVAKAIKAAAPAGVPVRVFMGIHHNGYTEKSRPFIEDSLRWEALDGLDLHGTETVPLEPWTADVWKRARESGKRTKAHAGEFCGPEFVWQVVEELGVRRIQHGVRSVDSPRLLRHLADIGAILDVCPISNVKLAVVERMQDHPIRELFEAGVTCTLSTDDPISFGNTLGEEYTALYNELGFSYAELGELAANGFRHAIGSKEQFTGHLDTIAATVSRFSNPSES
ncbi:adenosine deaminase [Puniceicoccales bacterium CK1056]|uniref:Adenosine deaminase n=1 Tax=Oceanipulchritudo coccoides TaxID=2706888 RepID=A0A6B2M5D4_9BACT|nr:adenosine deaminase [Oceanipulchritudo coccoides]NDV63015.1 adenosine deaminase [Oceanipulchritudo coccoides]